MPAPPAPPHPRRSALLLVLGCAAPLASAASDPGDAATAALELASVPDGRCQILSEGGKLRVLRNTDATRAVRYRLTRTFVGKPQGLSVGVAPPGGADVGLGCTLVDGKPQDWTVERAEFTAEDAE